MRGEVLRRELRRRPGLRVRVAVVGHVELAELLRVESFPARGEVIDASSRTLLAAGSGGIGALQLAKLAGNVSFYTRLTDDEHGRAIRDELEDQGVKLEATYVPGVQRRAVVLVDDTSERTIVVHGEKLFPLGSDDLPWSELAGYDGVFFFCGDQAALRAARRAAVLAATARWLPVLRSSGVQLDAIVGSGLDLDERYEHGDLSPVPGLVVTTEGARGGALSVAGGPYRRFDPAPPPGRAIDAYGCGDSFAAGLLFALAERRSPEAAVSFAARCGAACLTGEALTEQLRLAVTGRAPRAAVTP
jgi:ribokinase